MHERIKYNEDKLLSKEEELSTRNCYNGKDKCMSKSIFQEKYNFIIYFYFTRLKQIKSTKTKEIQGIFNINLRYKECKCFGRIKKKVQIFG